MTTSGRRPVNKPAGSTSGKQAGASTSGKQAGGAAKGGATSGRRPARPRPDDEQEEPSGAKQFMFYGTIGLIVVVIVLFIVKAPTIFSEKPKPQPKVVIDHSKIIQGVRDLREKATQQYKAAIKLGDQDARNKGIRQSLETLATAQEKLEALSDDPAYKGKEEYDNLFAELQTKISLDMKSFRDTIRMGH